jgi:hypothetical protein
MFHVEQLGRVTSDLVQLLLLFSRAATPVLQLLLLALYQIGQINFSPAERPSSFSRYNLYKRISLINY